MKRRVFPILTTVLMRILLITVNFYFPSCLNAQDVPNAEIKMYNGTPAIFVNDNPITGFNYLSYRGGPEMKQVKEIGVDIGRFMIASSYDWFNYSYKELVWKSPEEYDFSMADKKFNNLFEDNPDAYILPVVGIYSPPWWNSLHPDEMMVFDKTSGPLKYGYTINETVPSFASVKWREAAAENLRCLIKHIQSQPYGKNVIGYHLVTGSSNEWLYWYHPMDAIGDFSKPQLEAFQRWLRDKYKSNDALCRAWNNPGVTFQTVTIPSDIERKKGTYFSFRDPSKTQDVIDYMQFHNWIVMDTIKYFSRVVKEACNNKTLVGTRYGYTVHETGRDTLEERGHLAMSELLESPYIDFYTSPCLYDYREAGTGYSVFMSAQKSVQLHSKLWISQNDLRTHLVSWQRGYGRTPHFEDTEAVQLRQISNEITHASGSSWTGKYDSQMLDFFKKINAICERSIDFNLTSSAEIAVVVDEYSNHMMKRDMRLSCPLVYGQVLQMGKIGAPVDYILLNDINMARPYKLYIFLNTFHVSEKQKMMIEKTFRQGNKSNSLGICAGICRKNS